MNDEFEYMVTPLVFNVCLKLKCEGNSSEDKEKDILSNEQITKIDALFASKPSNKTGISNEGIQSIKLKRKKNKELFEDKVGKIHQNKK